jgi:molybdenum cofactor cytidylyltransferase
MLADPYSSVSAIILAAGESKRMGMPKALCQWGQGTFLEAVVSALREAEIQNIGVVLGALEQEIRAHGLPNGIQVWSNPNYYQGQLSSLQVALKNQSPEILGTVVALVDHPATESKTIRALIHAFKNDSSKVIRPSYQEQKGHPILIGRHWWADIVSASTILSLRDMLSRHPEKVITTGVNDPGILLDIDTPEILSQWHL